MSQADREKWDARYREGWPEGAEPSPWLVSLDPILPRVGRALDLAGGAGRHAVWLARRGLHVLVADVSEVGLGLARATAGRAGVLVETRAIDLEAEPLPEGPWDVVLSFHFLRRELFAQLPGVMAPGGLLVFDHQTRSNLERHPRPPAAFLLDDGELPSLVAPTGLEVVRYEEGWLDEGRHEARMIARKPA